MLDIKRLFILIFSLPNPKNQWYNIFVGWAEFLILM